MTDTYDIAIIGAGPGGYVAAIRASQLGMKAALVEKDQVGGTCLNRGCVPTKALLRSAEAWSLAQSAAEYGVQLTGATVDWAQIQKRKEQVVSRLRKGVESLLKKNQVTLVQGTATLLSPASLRVQKADGATETLSARHILIASGARAKTLPGVTIDEERVLSSTGALELDHIPASLVVIGAGAVGVEFACLFQTLGSKVTLLEALPQVLPAEDAEVAEELAKSLKRQRIRVEVGARVEKVETDEQGVRVAFTTAAGKAETVAAEKLLMAVGRGPATDGLGLEAAGVKTDRGFIPVNGHMQTNVPSIYAIGDCVPTLQLAHVASAEGIVAVEHMAGLNPRPLNYDHMPRAVYSRPEVASVGLTEAQAREKGHAVRTAKFPFMACSKAVILGEREGFVKLVVSEAYDALLGVQIIGPGATELIGEAVLALRQEFTAEEFSRAVRPHPTLSEAVMEAAHAAAGMPIHY
ncbi:MAG: dihydrolipoyl dehydrogenase [Anaerolineales bacterium]